VFYELRALKQQAAENGSSSTGARLQALTEQFKTMQVPAHTHHVRPLKHGGCFADVPSLSWFSAPQAKAADLVVPNAYGSTLTREGGVGLNATTSLDQV
jgi:hypothetical protein